VILAQDPLTRVEASNPSNESPLMMAAIHNQLEVATVLIERGAEVNRKGWTALHYAATRGHIAMMRLLLENSAYIDAESPNGTTPLMMAAYYAPPLAVKLLLEEGADPTLRNQAKVNALEMALANERKQSAFYLQAFTQAWEIREAGE
jgi:ankyrin repeat protein